MAGKLYIVYLWSPETMPNSLDLQYTLDREKALAWMDRNGNCYKGDLMIKEVELL